MTVSFVVTSYDIAPYVARCLESVAACARPGDQVILVDDGSRDGTDRIARDIFAEGRFGPEVEGALIELGANTPGGVGTGANIGMRAATRDRLVFVDGDDWLEPTGFARALAVSRATGAEVTVASYREWDEAAAAPRLPADAHRWNRPPGALPDRLRALRHIAVPWRKVYRRDFLESHRLRFPEGDFFFEDNPFHWRVCIAASSFAFVDAVVCHHRVNRPGQTMASTGAELAAFFEHHRTIVAGLGRRDHGLQVEALRWLVSNMSWQVDRLAPSAILGYAAAAADCLRTVPDRVWNGLPTAGLDGVGPNVHRVAGLLRRGEIAAVTADLQGRALAREIAARDAIADAVAADAAAARAAAEGMAAAARFEALRALAPDAG